MTLIYILLWSWACTKFCMLRHAHHRHAVNRGLYLFWYHLASQSGPLLGFKVRFFSSVGTWHNIGQQTRTYAAVIVQRYRVAKHRRQQMMQSRWIVRGNSENPWSHAGHQIHCFKTVGHVCVLGQEVCQVKAASFSSRLCLCCFHFPHLFGKPACKILVSAAQGQLYGTIAHRNKTLLSPS